MRPRLIASLFAALAAALSATAQETHGRLWAQLQDERGLPVTARVYLRGEDGTFHVPDGSIARGRKERFFHAHGHFQLSLPVGRYSIEAVKGFEAGRRRPVEGVMPRIRTNLHPEGMRSKAKPPAAQGRISGFLA